MSGTIFRTTIKVPVTQPVEKRPKVTLFVLYNGQRIPLARYGTTIGGWRMEKVGDTVMWKYKESPTGWRVWKRIVASPVWLPPDGTPPEDLLKKRRERKPDEPPYEIKYHEIGPSYASAYGLVAAYHQKYTRKADGTMDVWGDEGIRTHGSVNYMSIMRLYSHGCHRLHNHIALRLMSFVLAHRPHQRLGQEKLGFEKIIEYEGVSYDIKLDQGGYAFELDTPIEVNVLEGNIRGKVKEPIEIPIPKYDPDAGAYIMPDAGPVLIRDGVIVPVSSSHQLDAGVKGQISPHAPDAGAATASARTSASSLAPAAAHVAAATHAPAPVKTPAAAHAPAPVPAPAPTPAAGH